MTTIAWDGKSLAADTRCTTGGMPWQTTKAVRLKDGRLFAASGAGEDCEAVRTWLEGGEKPTPKDFVAILIENGECIRMEDKLVKMRVESPFHAVGSGRDYAIAAMHYGKTAREAIELAALYDIYTGTPVTVLTCEPSNVAYLTELQRLSKYGVVVSSDGTRAVGQE